MSGVRLPLQLGRGSLNQGTRFAALVWLGPLLLIVAAMIQDQQHLALLPVVMAVGLAGIAAAAFAWDAADTAKRDRPCDLRLDATGFSIEGGPLDGTRYAWSEVDAARCEIIDAEPRVAVRWWLLDLLTARKIAFISRRASVSVKQLQLRRKASRKGDEAKPLVLAEGEGDEQQSLAQLRDSIRATASPDTDLDPPPLPQEILRCPQCDAPQVPAATPTMRCPYCGHELAVPAELHERVRAAADLERLRGFSPAKSVRKLVDQPSARRAGSVVAWCRRAMVWIQPFAAIALIALLYHQTHGAELPDGMGIARDAPSDDGVFLYDLILLGAIVAGTFGIAWSLGHAYVSNRQALRVLIDDFGAVPPVKPGAPSTCHNCGAPLRATEELLVRCVYCSADNVLGADPRPAALRRNRQKFGIDRGLLHRRRARLRMAVVLPISAALTLAMVHELRLAWYIPEHSVPGFSGAGLGRWGTVVNADSIPRTFTLLKAGTRVPTTVLPHGSASWSCFSDCTLDPDGAKITPEWGTEIDTRIESGQLHAATH